MPVVDMLLLHRNLPIIGMLVLLSLARWDVCGDWFMTRYSNSIWIFGLGSASTKLAEDTTTGTPNSGISFVASRPGLVLTRAIVTTSYQLSHYSESVWFG